MFNRRLNHLYLLVLLALSFVTVLYYTSGIDILLLSVFLPLIWFVSLCFFFVNLALQSKC